MKANNLINIALLTGMLTLNGLYASAAYPVYNTSVNGDIETNEESVYTPIVENGKWSDPMTWNRGTVPGSNEDIVITGSIVLDEEVTIGLNGSLTVRQNASLIGKELINKGNVINEGLINVRYFTNIYGSEFTNRNYMGVGVDMVNHGKFINVATEKMFIGRNLKNNGDFINEGQIQLEYGDLTNYRKFRNTGDIFLSGSMNNFSEFLNDANVIMSGKFYNGGRICGNGGVFEVCGDVTNKGQVEGNVYLCTSFCAGEKEKTKEYPGFEEGCEYALPIEILSFEAMPTRGQVKLEWISDKGSADYFVVERSTDGERFREVTEVTHLGEGRYSYKDSDVHGDRAYYRLKRVDSEGNVEITGKLLVYL